jgi:hypothetical protein
MSQSAPQRKVASKSASPAATMPSPHAPCRRISATKIARFFPRMARSVLSVTL